MFGLRLFGQLRDYRNRTLSPLTRRWTHKSTTLTACLVSLRVHDSCKVYVKLYVSGECVRNRDRALRRLKRRVWLFHVVVCGCIVVQTSVTHNQTDQP